MRAALLDENGVFLRMDEVDTPTARHLPQITSCDLPPGRYKWIPGDNPEGGQFVEVAWLERFEATRREAAEAAVRAAEFERIRRMPAAERRAARAAARGKSG